jgi:WD40 repeat protein
MDRAALSPDGKLLVTDAGDDNLIVWDAITGLELRTIRCMQYEFDDPALRDFRKGRETVAAMAFAADSCYLHVLSHNGVLRGCDVTTGTWSEPLARTAGALPDVPNLNFSIGSASPDGTHFAFSPQIAPYRIEVFAIGKEKPIVTIKDEKLAEWGRGCRLSHDNKLLAVSVGGQAVRVWEVASGRVVATYAGPDLRLLTFAFSPDGKTLAAMFIAMSERLRMSDPKTLVLWDTSLGVERLRIPDWKGYVVGYSHGGKKLVSLDQNEVVLADAATGKPTGSLNGHAANERLHFAFSPDLRKLVTTGGRDRSAIIWDLETQKPVLDFDGPRGTILALAISPDGESIFASTSQEQGDLWDAKSGRRKHRLDSDRKGVGECAAFTPDGRRVVVGYGWGGGGTSTDGNWAARLWSVSDGKLIREIGVHGDGVRQIAISPDGNHLVTRDIRGPWGLRQWEMETGKQVLHSAWTRDYTARFAFSRSGHVVGVAPAEFQPTTEVKMGYPLGGPRSVNWRKPERASIHALSPDGDFVAMREELGGREQIVIRRAATGEVVKGLLLDDRVSHMSPVTFSPNSQFVAVGTHDWNDLNPTVHIFELQTGREVRMLRGHRGPISAIAFTPDGKRVATGSSDCTVLVWDLTNQR